MRFSKNSKKLKPGVWKDDIDTRRIFNFDKTPQFINYGVDGTNTGLAYAAHWEPCRKMIRKNRESITICPVVSLAGETVVSQVIFAGKDITSHLAPKTAVKNIKNLIILSTEKGNQDNHSLLDLHKKFDMYFLEENIHRPVVMLADGRSSRFDYNVLHFLHEKN
ncbi:uncharacterized protein LOC136080032 [Hydra vulgaris]|uniref:Uncharacterized protein LOC136080032 n=1 Tax=Hydra vulgaris TaxID=6087 RepID=A0ABM4BU97_HYDVU